MSLDEAIRSIARAGGYVVERQNGTYFVMQEDQAGKVAGSGFTIVKSMPVRFTPTRPSWNPSSGIYLSDFGNITALPERKLLVVEDQPGFVYRISQLVAELDQRPPQVLIEAKILEIKLSDELSYGIDWQARFHQWRRFRRFWPAGPPVTGQQRQRRLFLQLPGTQHRGQPATARA